MALAHTLLATAVDAGSPGTISVTVDLDVGKLYTVFVENSNLAVTVDSPNETIDSVGTALTVGGNTNLSAHRFEASGNRTAEVITATLTGGPGTGAGMIVIETTGHWAGANGANAIGRLYSTSGSATSGTLTLPNGVSSGALAAFSYIANETANAGGDSTELGNTNHATPNDGLIVVSDDDATLQAAWTSNVGWGAVGFEVLAAEDEFTAVALGNVTNSGTLTTTASCGAGRVVAAVYWYGTQNITGATDDGPGLTWVVDEDYRGSSAGDQNVAIISAGAPSGWTSGDAITPTFSGTPSFGPGIAAVGIEGLDEGSSGHVDVVATPVADFEEAWSSGTLTITEEGILVAFSVGGAGTSSTAYAPGIEYADWTTEGTQRGTVVVRRAIATGNYKLSALWSATVGFQHNIALSYKLDAGGGGTPQLLSASFGNITAINPALRTPKQLEAAFANSTAIAASLRTPKLLAAPILTISAFAAAVRVPKSLAAEILTISSINGRLDVGLAIAIARYVKLRIGLGIGV